MRVGDCPEEVQRDVRLVADHLAVVPGRHREEVAGSDVDDPAVVHGDAVPPRNDHPHVLDLAAGLAERTTHVLGPLPARLVARPTQRHPAELELLELPEGISRSSSGASKRRTVNSIRASRLSAAARQSRGDGRPRIVGGPGRADVVGVRHRPLHQRPDRLEERAPERRERVVDARWHDRVHGSRHQPVALQPADRHGQHPLADPVDAAQQLREAPRSVTEQVDHEHGPLVADAVEHLAQVALGHVNRKGCGPSPGFVAVSMGYLAVTG